MSDDKNILYVIIKSASMNGQKLFMNGVSAVGDVTWIQDALDNIGISDRVLDVKPVTGGDINEAYVAMTDSNTFFVKAHREMTEEFYKSEADGLRLMGRQNGVRVPEVYGVFALEAPRRSGLVMEWVEPGAKQGLGKELARTVSSLHSAAGPRFGYNQTTYLGKIPLANEWYDNWCEYYRKMRLEPQQKIAAQRGFMTYERERRMDDILSRLEEWIPAAGITPRLLHGDLWAGNWLPDHNGKVYLIDPSVFYGHHEMDLAMTELFGGFSNTFYDLYSEHINIDREYENRKPLYQLFYLLMHLNTFGTVYVSQVDAVLKRYSR